MSQWMRLCLGAPKVSFDMVGGALQQPADHARARSNGDDPASRDHVLAYRVS